MRKQLFIYLSLVTFVASGLVHAQGGVRKSKNTDGLARTLRVIVAGTRPLPVFRQVGDKIIEVEPSINLLPPNSFSFVNKSHSPRSRPGNPKKTSYSTRSAKLVRIEHYKGPSVLPLKLSRPLIEAAGAGQQVKCNLGKSTNPLVLLHADSGNSGWGDPQAKVMDMNPKKVPAGSVTLVNFTDAALKIYVSKKGVVVAPHKHVTVSLPKATRDSFKYKIEASAGKKIMNISNSRYRIKKDSRIIMLALPGTKVNSHSFPRPKIKIITDSV